MKTADPELMRAINRFHVMDVVRKHGPISRTEISARTELSAATVSAITAALLDDALIDIRRVPATEGLRGRPRVMLELRAAAAHVVGVKLTSHAVSIAVTNFAADPLATLNMPVRCERQKMAVIVDIVEDGIRHSVGDAGLAMADIHGVCIGLPGIVDTDAGMCWRSPIFGPDAVPIGSAFAERLAVDTRIESDVNLVTLAEHWFGRGREVEDFVVVALEETVRLGIIHKGELFRGGAGLSADLGWCRQEDDGDYRQREVQPDTHGEGAVLGRAIANLASLLAPPLVILVGRGVRAGAALLEPLRHAFRQALSPPLAERIELVTDDWDDDAWARGAAALVLRDLYGAPWGTTGPRLQHINGA